MISANKVLATLRKHSNSHHNNNYAFIEKKDFESYENRLKLRKENVTQFLKDCKDQPRIHHIMIKSKSTHLKPH